MSVPNSNSNPTSTTCFSRLHYSQKSLSDLEELLKFLCRMN